MPPTPSWLCATGSIIFGTKPPTSVPVVSVRYLPTVPLELASPFGNDADFEFSRRRDVSHALAARTTTRASTWCSLPSIELTYVTPLALPERPRVPPRAIAFATSVSWPVARAGAISTFVEEKFELVLQPRLHCPQKWHFARPLSGCVRIDSRDGTHVTLRRLAASMTSSRSEERRVGKECRSQWSP